MKRLLVSILFILLGLSILLANLNIGGSRALLADWWPLFLIAGGGLIWLNDRRSYLWALVVSLFGVGLLMNSLDIASVSLGDFIAPAVLITFGLSLLTRSGAKRSQNTSTNSEDITAILAGVNSRNVSKDFMGARVTAILGGVEMDLSKASITKDAVLEVMVLMGGIELRVPENVIVKNRSLCLLGGIEDKTTPQDDKNAPTLYIDGNITMGGIEIKR